MHLNVDAILVDNGVLGCPIYPCVQEYRQARRRGGRLQRGRRGRRGKRDGAQAAYGQSGSGKRSYLNMFYGI